MFDQVRAKTLCGLPLPFRCFLLQLRQRPIRSAGVWVAKDDRFPGSTNGACFILKKIGIDAVSSQPFPCLMIFPDNKRFEVRGDYRAERTVRSVQSATDGRFRITESLGKRWSLLFKRPVFMLKIVDAATIEVAEGNISTPFFQCPPNSPLL
jgi:hypothetical protein